MIVTPRRKADGSLDHRFNRASGMQANGTRVDFFQPRPVCAVCAWAGRNHRQPFPHTYKNAPHCWMKVAA